MLLYMIRRTVIVTALFSGLLILSASALADIYSKEDADGTVHFTNMRPSGKDRKKYKVYLKTPPIRMARAGVVPVPARSTDAARYSRYDSSIIEASRAFSIPEPFIRAVIRVESDYDPRVVSVAGAQGLMQLMPATAKRMGVRDSFEPHDNIMGGYAISTLPRQHVLRRYGAHHRGLPRRRRRRHEIPRRSPLRIHPRLHQESPEILQPFQGAHALKKRLFLCRKQIHRSEGERLAGGADKAGGVHQL